jgi:2,4-dienoyl-CoA reductase-like NADH-dependent reductase (Old Yellow Enzyme family)
MPRLTDPLELKSLRLRNRLVMAPMVTGLAVDHKPSEAQMAWYTERAKAGMGLVIVESCGIDPDATIMPNLLGIWDDTFVPGLTRMAAAIHSAGVPVVLQLVHGGARSLRTDPNQERVGPSAVPMLPGPPPRSMTEPEIQGVIEAFVAAALRAKAAGFDGVEIHAAHYYLLSEFLSPCTNRRTDGWGGDREGRARLVLETIRAVRRAVGPDYLLFCRMHAVEFLDGGMSEADACWFAKVFAEAGVDVLNASGIGQSSYGDWEGQAFLNTSSVLPKTTPAGTFAPYTARLRQGLGIPVIAVGKLGEKGLAQRVLAEDQADLVAIARQLIADPETGTKILEGREEDIQRCQECLACFASIRKGPIKCTVNKNL